MRTRSYRLMSNVLLSANNIKKKMIERKTPSKITGRIYARNYVNIQYAWKIEGVQLRKNRNNRSSSSQKTNPTCLKTGRVQLSLGNGLGFAARPTGGSGRSTDRTGRWIFLPTTLECIADGTAFVGIRILKLASRSALFRVTSTQQHLSLCGSTVPAAVQLLFEILPDLGVDLRTRCEMRADRV